MALRRFLNYLPRKDTRNVLSLCRKIHSLTTFNLNPAEYDSTYLLNAVNKDEIKRNINARKGIGDIEAVHDLNDKLRHEESNDYKIALNEELNKIPNKTHPLVLENSPSEPTILKTAGEKIQFAFKPKRFQELALLEKSSKNDFLRTNNLGYTNGHRSYVFKNDLADLEQALIRYTIKKLIKLGFNLMSVPDIAHPTVLEGCGMETKGKRTQVFEINSPWPNLPLCLAGTAEVGFGGFLAGKCFEAAQLPMRLCAVSRCYRPEMAFASEEKGGIYRVHEFTKVEMFGVVATGVESDKLLQEFCNIQQNIFSELGLHIKVLDMPPHELGAAAYRKFDIEAWFYGREMFGEISSASNCTDYQSRRLGIKYKQNEETKHSHTINGTACAIPRMIMAIVEQYQTENQMITMPDALVPFMNGRKFIGNTQHYHLGWVV